MRDVPNNLAMDGARDTVLQLEVHLGNGVFWEYGSVRDITYKKKVVSISSPVYETTIASQILKFHLSNRNLRVYDLRFDMAAVI